MIVRLSLPQSVNPQGDMTLNLGRVARNRAPRVAEPAESAGFVTRLFRGLAWLTLAAVVLITIVPAELRPSSMLPLKVERALGFCILALVFTLAYVRYWKIVLIALVASAFGFETLQFLIPSRDPSIVDASVKAIGAVSGVLAAKALAIIYQRRQSSLDKT